MHSNEPTPVFERRQATLTKLGKRIQVVRRQANMKQKELASICEFEKASMSRIEAGLTNITVLTLLRISIALRVDMSTLLDEPGNAVIRNLPDAQFGSMVREKVGNLRLP